MSADIILTNGKIVTIDAKESIAETVVVKFGRILAVGSNKEIKPLMGSSTKIIDLKGRTVIPGLIDSHCHITNAEGMMRVRGVIDASYEAGIRSIVDIQRAQRLADDI